MHRFLGIWFLILPFFINAQTAPGTYWIQFTDKNNNPYSINNPEAYLSQRAMERRIKYNIPVNQKDLPLTPEYIDSIEEYSSKILFTSKWFNSVTVELTDSTNILKIKALPFVDKLQKKNPAKTDTLATSITLPSPVYSMSYGEAFDQVAILNGHLLHRDEYQGQKMLIGVLDAGFHKVNQLPAFDHLFRNHQIIGARDFVSRGTNVYTQHQHGMLVLSCIAGIIPGRLFGTAPAASFLLIRTENVDSEYLVEEDAWIAGAEYADSAGADLINSSLGYAIFDDSTQNHSYSDLDGATLRISRAATIAASKGILVVSSAGNQGTQPWQYITAPADADSILTVGAVDLQRNYANFSSKGPSADGRVKPEVAAPGKDVVAASTNPGETIIASGTSLAAPLITGLSACLWQKYPEATNMEIRDAILRSANQFRNPDSLIGYGIPDYYMADQILGLKFHKELPDLGIAGSYPNPFFSYIELIFASPDDDEFTVELCNIQGQLQLAKQFQATAYQSNRILIQGLGNLPRGMYIVRISNGNESYYHKAIKW